MRDKYPPGPRDRFCGVTFVRPMRRDPLGFARRVAAEYGDFAYVRLGWVRLYFVNRPELIREVLVAKAKSFQKLTRQMKALRKIEGDGLVVAEGETWARHRPVVQGSFHTRHFPGYADTVTACVRRRLDGWRPDEPFDLVPEMNEMALEVIARIVFDVDLAAQATSLRNAVHEFREAMQSEASASINPPDWLPLPSKIRQKKALKVLDDLLWGLIRARQAAGGAGTEMLSQILAAVKQAGTGITDREVRDEVSTLFVAGHDTTSAASAWLFYALSQNPEAERRAIAEVDALGGKPLTHDDLPRLKYVEMVVKESMRMFPASAFLFGREALEAVELGGHTLKKGSWVFMSPFIVQRDPRYFPDPDVFDPERFAPGRADRLTPYSYIVFGAGARTCIGNTLATMELTLLAATVLQRYRLVLDQGPPDLELNIVLRPKGGLRMRAVPR